MSNSRRNWVVCIHGVVTSGWVGRKNTTFKNRVGQAGVCEDSWPAPGGRVLRTGVRGAADGHHQHLLHAAAACPSSRPSLVPFSPRESRRHHHAVHRRHHHTVYRRRHHAVHRGRRGSSRCAANVVSGEPASVARHPRAVDPV